MEPSPALTCPRCSAPRILRPECPQCGVIYAKADALAARRAAQRAEAPPAPVAPVPEEPPLIDPAWLVRPGELRSDVLPAPTPDLDGDSEEAAYERGLYTWVLPVTLAVAWAVVSGPSRFLVRLITMPFHELGHAVSAWLCGYMAFPTLWRTPIFGRSYLLAALAAAGLGTLAWRGWKQRRRDWMATGGGLLFLQLVGTLLLSEKQQLVLFSFGGDGGMMVLGTAMMATLYARPGSYLHEHSLRWGFLGLGALSFMDGFLTWWRARKDFSAIPFGRIEGVGLSDASKLVGPHGWGEHELVSRYVTLGVLCLVFLAALYAVKLLQARAGQSTAPKGQMNPG